MLEFVVEFVFEFLLQLFIELFSWGVHSRSGLRKPVSSRLLKSLGYLLFGALLGYLSYLLVPRTFTGYPPSLLVSVLLIPLSVGVTCTLIARWAEAKWDEDYGVSRFSFSFILAWGFSTVRYLLLL